MEIIRSLSSIHKVKSSGTRVNYYLQKEYEIHYSEIPPETLQEWHFHNTIEETILILCGRLEVRWVAENDIRKSTVGKGDLIRVENTPHTFVNQGNKSATFVVFKMMLEGKDNSEIFKKDKIYFDLPG